MDCAAEAAILAYFAEPSVGGPNAKATNNAALSTSDASSPAMPPSNTTFASHRDWAGSYIGGGATLKRTSGCLRAVRSCRE
jgi:hypothetical protein